MINEDIRHIIEPELREGEELLWVDKPSKLVFSAIEKSMIIFLVFWLVMVCLISLPGILTSNGSHKVTVNGVEKYVSLTEYLAFLSIFPLIGLGMLAIVFGYAYLRTGHYYGITDKRAIIISKFLGKRVASLAPDKMSKIETSGTKELGSVSFFYKPTSRLNSLMMPFELNTFSGIKNLHEVEGLLLSLQNKGTAP